MLNATWNCVKHRTLAWSLSRSHGSLHNVHVTAHDSIEHVIFEGFCCGVHGGSVGRASVFRAEDVVSNLALVTSFFFFLIPM